MEYNHTDIATKGMALKPWNHVTATGGGEAYLAAEQNSSCWGRGDKNTVRGDKSPV